MSGNVDTATKAIGAGSLLLFGVGYVFQITALTGVSALVLLIAIVRVLVLDANGTR